MSESFRVEIDVDDPAAIFREQKGEARISEHELAALPDAGASFAAAIRVYVATHPKLDVVTLIHRAEVDELVIRWRWRS